MTVKIDIFRRAWLRVRYNLKPQLAAARSRLEPLRTGVKVRRTSVLTGVALLLMASLWMLLSDQRRGEPAELRAELAETREALRTARQTLRLRARAIEIAESEIAVLRQELQKVRAAAAHHANEPVLAADDPWLIKRAQ